MTSAATPIAPSTTNPVLRMLRETAEVVSKPQSTVAANWLRTPAMTKYSPARNVGVTRAQFNEAMVIIRRLANA